MSLSPASLSFGNQAVDITSAPQTIAVTNTGPGAATVTSIQITDVLQDAEFSESDDCPRSPSTLAAGARCSIKVTFRPDVVGTRTGTLRVYDNSSNSPQIASLTGTGVNTSASLTPSSLTFGSQQVGTTSAAQTLTLTNTGQYSMTCCSILFRATSLNPGDYAESNNCPQSGTLAPGASCTISVKFTPTASGTRTATVEVDDSAGTSPQTADLTGTGSPRPEAAPTPLLFRSRTILIRAARLSPHSRCPLRPTPATSW